VKALAGDVPSVDQLDAQPIRMTSINRATYKPKPAMTRIIPSVVLMLMFSACTHAADHPLVPRIVGEWWTVAGNPDLGALTGEKQQVVDFGIWTAADGTWQIWACIRATKAPGKTRLFHRWEGARLTDRDWTPKGVAQQADPSLGENEGGMQAPYVIRHDGKFWMFYGDWANICLATSVDGKAFTRHRGANGRPQLAFPNPRGFDDNTRDAMVLRIDDRWHCYFTAHPGRKGAVYVRTSASADFASWSAERMVAARGRSGDGPFTAECPFVVEPRPGHFYLFRTETYGRFAKTHVYHSRDPMDFGIDNDGAHYVTTLPIAAPEIFQHEGRWYMAALLSSFQGIQIARMEWAATSEGAASK
jgi:hypothetical protein